MSAILPAVHDDDRLRSHIERVTASFVDRLIAAGRDPTAQGLVLEDLRRMLEAIGDHPRSGLSPTERARWANVVHERVEHLRVMLGEPPVWN